MNVYFAAIFSGEETLYETVKASTKKIAEKRAKEIADKIFDKAQVYVERITVKKAIAIEKLIPRPIDIEWQFDLSAIAEEYIWSHACQLPA